MGGGDGNFTYENITVYQDSTALASIYSEVRDSVVLVQGTTPDGVVQGSGFVYQFDNRMVVVTNNHVVQDTTSLSVTFSNGNGYAANVLGSDAYADLAVVSVDAPSDQFKPVEIVSSSTLRVGDQVIAIGNPYGLVGSLTTGVVSAVGRTITEDTAGGFSIANIIQTSTPINPGNSGGPLLNVLGKVVGITTAIVSESQGLGFAVPSNTILREISALITTGTYRGHSYLGVTGSDMNYDIAQQIGSSVTYGWRIASVAAGGPSEGKLQVDDIVVAMDGNLIRNNDDLASYLEEHTLPNQNIVVTVMRGNAREDETIILGTRPAPT
jgi:S1-C subfamily serine protease